MRWTRVHQFGFDHGYLVPDPGETDEIIVAAVAAASFNLAFPEGYGWEHYDPTVEVTVSTVRSLLPEAFEPPILALPPDDTDADDDDLLADEDVLSMDYVRGRRCKTHIARERRGEHQGALRLDVSTYEATRGDVTRLLEAAQALLRQASSG